MAATETLQSDSEELSVASHWVLPSQEFHHIWQNLFYDNDIKNDVSKFIYIIRSMCSYICIIKNYFFFGNTHVIYAILNYVS